MTWKGERKTVLEVGIVGLGYVGLPLALGFANAGCEVVGFDIDLKKVETLNRGGSYIGSISALTVQEQVSAGRFRATKDYGEVAGMDAVIICVPTPLNAMREPDLSFIVSTGAALAPHVRAGMLVCLESTTYPGTTEEVLLPILERGSGLRAGVDFLLVFSPEREDPGSSFNTREIPKVIGGLTPSCLAAGKSLYLRAIKQVVTVSGTRVAEAAKLLENIFRCVNIALVNELKVVFDRMGINVWEVIEAARTKPFGFMPFYPGPGLGGHCIPIDPFYLTWKAREFGVQTKFIELAGEINTAMPRYVVSRLMEVLSDHGKPLKGARLLLLGLAYKKNVDDPRESPSFELWELLLERGAEVCYHDSHIPRAPRMRRHPELEGMTSVELLPEILRKMDAVVIVTDHDDVDYVQVVRNAPLIVDTRNACKGVPEEIQCGKVIRA